MMDIYLVGGAVRDELLGLKVVDKDWVVVGASVNDMLSQGYTQVGKDFPVFLHPKTKEEYALARKERKQGTGYHGFVCDFSPDVSLEDDLLRRDLTINAIAQTNDTRIIDPFHGQQDLKDKQLRHVSNAFSEDPLRVLRVARFAARFFSLGFTIADETLALMRTMSTLEELGTIAPERIWRETEKALQTDHPQVYFETLRTCGALGVLFPEIAALFGVPQTEKHHPEIDTGIHTLMVLEQATKLSSSLPVRFAALTHDLGKAVTDNSQWPRHIGHEKLGKSLVRQCCKRLGISKEITFLAEKVCEFHLHCHRAFELKASSIQKLFKNLDVYRKPQQLEPFLLACEADSKGRLGFTERPYPQATYLQTCFQAAAAVSIRDIDPSELKGPEIGQAIENKRIEAIEAVKQKTHQAP